MEITQLEVTFCKDLYKGIDTQILAKNLGIHKSTLYDIESGRRKMSDELFNKITKFYGIKYCDEEKLYDEVYNMLVNMFEYFISYQSDKIFELYKYYDENRDIFNYSKAFIYVNLIEAIYYTEIDDNNKVEELLKLSKQYLDFYDNNVIYIYAMLWIFLKDIDNELEEMKAVILPLYKKYSVIDISKYILGMLYFQLGRIYQVDGNIIEGMNYYNKSIEVYQGLNIYQRVIQSKIQIGTCYFLLNKLKIAEEMYLELLDESIKNDFVYRIRPCCENLAFLYFSIKDYDNALKYIELTRKSGSLQPDVNYYEAYIYYQIKERSIARKKILNLIDQETDKRVLHTLKFIHAMLNNNDINIVKYFELSKNDNIKIKANIDEKLLYKMLITYYEDQNDVGNANKIMHEYVEKY